MSWLAILLLFLSGCKTQTGQDNRPNIVIILADDLGFSDLGCYGGEIQTPNVDWLAAHGLRYTQFYNTSRCCPSRASLLTGLYNHQAGVGEMTSDRHLPGYRGHLTANTVTLAEILRSSGYRTAMSGKWHVANTIEQPTPDRQLAWLNHQEHHPLFAPLEQYPTYRGFDKYFGNIWGVVDFFDPFSLVSGTKPIDSVPSGYYHTDAINDTAVAYIQAFAEEDQPFFIYVAHTAPHWPLMALPEDIEKYEDTYRVGWDAIRQSRYRRLLELGILDSTDTKCSPRYDENLSWEDNPDSIWDARAMAVHAAMVDRMDQGIGRIIDVLRQTGKLDNTLILILSDNGASAENAAAYGPGFDRPSRTRTGLEMVYDTAKQILPGAETSYVSIGARWANVCNTPFRYWKAQSYEGGIHTPLIVFWPHGITRPERGIIRKVGHVMDIMPTVVELSGAEYPSRINGEPITPIQGQSLVPTFTGQEENRLIPIFNEHFGAQYVRSGDWKLVKSNGEEWHLYDLAKDKTELVDLASKAPDQVQLLDSLWQDWAKTHNVFPKQ